MIWAPTARAEVPEGVTGGFAALGALPVRAEGDTLFCNEVPIRGPPAVGFGAIPQGLALTLVDEVGETSQADGTG